MLKTEIYGVDCQLDYLQRRMKKQEIEDEGRKQDDKN